MCMREIKIRVNVCMKSIRYRYRVNVCIKAIGQRVKVSVQAIKYRVNLYMNVIG